MRRVLLKILLFVLVYAVGLAAGLGFGYLRLKHLRTDMSQETARLETRESLIKQKYLEQKALSGQLMRDKAALDGQKLAVEQELERLKQEKTAFLQEYDTLNAKIKQEITALENEIKSLAQKNERLSAEQNNLKEMIEQGTRTVAEREAEIRQLLSEKKDLENRLQRAGHDVERCEAKNARLAVLADELIESYKNKGIAGVILQKEPFTGIKEIEQEALLREYREKIEKETLKANRP